MSGVQAATYSYIGEFHSNATRTRAAAFVAMFMPACFVYLPLLAWLIIPMQWELYLLDFKIAPWRLYLFCSSLLNCVNFICMYFLPESPKFLLSIDKKAESLAVLRKMYEINTGNPQEVRQRLKKFEGEKSISRIREMRLSTLLHEIAAHRSRRVLIFLPHLHIYHSQTFPVKDLVAESTGTNLSDVRGIGGVLKLLWNQTWPLFMPPHLGNTIKLCYLMFILFSVGHGTFMW